MHCLCGKHTVSSLASIDGITILSPSLQSQLEDTIGRIWPTGDWRRCLEYHCVGQWPQRSRLLLHPGMGSGSPGGFRVNVVLQSWALGCQPYSEPEQSTLFSQLYRICPMLKQQHVNVQPFLSPMSHPNLSQRLIRDTHAGTGSSPLSQSVNSNMTFLFQNSRNPGQTTKTC